MTGVDGAASVEAGLAVEVGVGAEVEVVEVEAVEVEVVEVGTELEVGLEVASASAPGDAAAMSARAAVRAIKGRRKDIETIYQTCPGAPVF